MNKYVLKSETHNGVIKCKKDMPENEVLKLAQRIEPQNKWLSCRKLTKGNHLCKHCGDIAEGEYEDLLCPECRETFGHSLYSEL